MKSTYFIEQKYNKSIIYQLIYNICMYSKMEFKNSVLRYPTLDTVLMIEEEIEKAKSDKTIRQVWQSLPKKVMWQTFMTTIEYLEHSGKILIDKEKNVIWIWDPSAIEKLKLQNLTK